MEQDDRKIQISVHVTEPLRAQIEAAARRAWRSVSSEIAWRVERSLADDRESGAAA